MKTKLFLIAMLFSSLELSAQCSSLYFNNFPVVCENTAAYTLTGGSPSPGIYFGQGVINGKFYPGNVGPGSHIIGYSSSSCADTAFDNIIVETKPSITMSTVPSPTPNPPSDPANLVVVSHGGDTVEVTVTSNPAGLGAIFFPALNYQYYFGTHLLYPDTNFKYAVLVSATNGCNDTGSVEIRVCKADYIKSQAIDSNSNLVPSHVVITDKSLGSNLSYAWDFGDGSSSSLKDPSHTYAGNGPYNLCLTITDGLCSDTYCDSVSIDSNGLVMKQGPGFTIHIGEYNAFLGEEEYLNARNLRVYPNPVMDELNIETELSNYNLLIHNSIGQLVLTKKMPPNGVIDVSQFEKGLYYGKIQGDAGNQQSFRFIKE